MMNEAEVSEKGKKGKKGGTDAELLKILTGIAESVSNLSRRVTDIETGGKERFKDAVKEEDVKAASVTRVGVDPKITQMVNELLGEDFGVRVDPFGDRPGFLFTIIVPQRLSDNVVDKRPVKDPEDPTKYLKDKIGNVIFEDYIPEDRRSRAISSTASYDSIRQHCEKVRAYIVAYHQKLQKPLPEFRVR